jgi:hypothetical protein
VIVAGKTIQPDAAELASGAMKQGMDVAYDIVHPTLNQRCYRCGEHHGWVCVCTVEQKAEWWGANWERLHRERPPKD